MIKKTILIAMSMACIVTLHAQSSTNSVNVNDVKAKKTFTLRDKKVDSIGVGTNFNTHSKIPTSLAINNFMEGRKLFYVYGGNLGTSLVRKSGDSIIFKNVVAKGKMKITSTDDSTAYFDAVDTCVYVQALQSASISNTATETSLLGTTNGVGSLTLPAGFFYKGKVLEITLSTIMSTPATADNLTIKLYLGALNVSTVVIPGSQINALTSKRVVVHYILTARSSGTTSAVKFTGSVDVENSISGIPIMATYPVDALFSSISNISSQLIAITAKWNAAQSGETISTNTGIFKSYN